MTGSGDGSQIDTVKCVLVGDSCVGKSCMRLAFEMDSFPERLTPTVVDNCLTKLDVDGKTVNLEIWDTAGVSEYDRLRRFTYPRTDVFIICFSLVAPSSLENIKNVWYPEIMAFCPITPVLLVGTKMDLRDAKCSPEQKAESEQQGHEMARQIGALKYIECSALENQGLTEIFEDAVRVAVAIPKTRDSCVIA